MAQQLDTAILDMMASALDALSNVACDEKLVPHCVSEGAAPAVVWRGGRVGVELWQGSSAGEPALPGLRGSRWNEHQAVLRQTPLLAPSRCSPMRVRRPQRGVGRR